MTITAHHHPDGVLEFVIEHPPVNAFCIADLHDLADRLAGVESRPDVCAVLLRAEGKGFCGGGDVKEVQALSGHDGILGQAGGSQEASLAAAECAVPVIAAVHGYCIGVGVLIVAMCDIIVAAHGTRFVLAEVDNGATSGGVQASALLPEKRLRAAMLTAEPFSAEELQAHGSVYRLVDESSVREEAMGLAKTIANKSPIVVRRLKQALNGSAGLAEIRTRYRAELSYTYELNLLGEAAERRGDFLSGQRAGYLSDTESDAAEGESWS